MSGVRELPDGRLLLSDFREPALWVVDLRAGTSERLGRSGDGPGEYRQPGGIYAGRADTSLVLDRGTSRVLLVTPDGRIAGSRAIGVRGTTVASSADQDLQRLDASGTGYFVDPQAAFGSLRAGRPSDSVSLWRYDAARQRADTVGMLREPERRLISAAGNVVRTRTVLFSPADGWGVAASGRVALIRAAPYRVDWVEPDGRVTRGPVTAHSVVQVTAADRERVAGRRETIGTAAPGSVSGSTNTEPLFADTKPVFKRDDIIVSPEGHVWVGRQLPASTRQEVYDVFDHRGMRIDRVELPAGSRVIGFGKGAVYVSESDQDDLPHLRRYSLNR
jgi:hypothetical protein